MKYVVLFFLFLYQIFVSPFIHAATGSVKACKYPVTCSEYAKSQIQEKGAIKGSILAIKRILSCHPLSKIT